MIPQRHSANRTLRDDREARALGTIGAATFVSARPRSCTRLRTPMPSSMPATIRTPTPSGTPTRQRTPMPLRTLALLTALVLSASMIGQALLVPPALYGAERVVEPAQTGQVRTTIAPDTILVGDVFVAALRIDLPAGATLSAPDTLPLDGPLENAGRVKRTTRDLQGGVTEVTLSYPLTAWRTGELPLPSIPIVISGPDGVHELTGDFPTARILSVLPADTAGITPRPPKDVLGASRLIWPWIVGALALVGAMAAFIIYQRRRRGLQPRLTFGVAQADSPRVRALAALDRIRDEEPIDTRDLKVFFSRTSTTLRRFLEEVDTGWGVELTTREILTACRDAFSEEDMNRLEQLLAAADQVKFNRREPDPASALAEWEAVRNWIDHLRIDSHETRDSNEPQDSHEPQDGQS